MEIGGYFELELTNRGSLHHDNAVLVNSGRNALLFIAQTHAYDKIYVPKFACDAVLQVLKKSKSQLEFYNLGPDFKPDVKEISNSEALLYINYFGLCDRIVKELSLSLTNLIVDNSQAFYSRPIQNVPTFYSPRKYFGVPDGGMIVDSTEEYSLLQRGKSKENYKHLLMRLDGQVTNGYEIFLKNEKLISEMPLMGMSRLTEALLRNCNFIEVGERRRMNFNYVHSKLKDVNLLSGFIDSVESDFTPMIYPFFIRNGENLRDYLIHNKIYSATYWESALSQLESTDIEYEWVKNIVALPIDQRYAKNDMKVMTDMIDKFIL